MISPAVFSGSIVVVAPFTGAWIEILVFYGELYAELEVAPFTGAWIEIHKGYILSRT